MEKIGFAKILLLAFALSAILSLTIPFIHAQANNAAAATHGAAPQTPLFSCSDLFVNGKLPSSSGNVQLVKPALVNNLNGLTTGGGLGIFSGIIKLSVLIVFMVLIMLGIVYAFGYAFGLNNVKQFVRTEMAESFFTLAIIVFIAGGLKFTGGIASGVTTAIGLTPVAHGGGIGTAPHLTDIRSLYIGICNNLQSGLIINGLTSWLGVLINLFINNLILSFTVYAMPNGFGFQVQPFAGAGLAVQQFLWDEQLIFFGAAETGIYIIMMFFVIYFLFPLFLFVGIALRSFPWTRAAGGSMIALFISFYIFLPALMYPFTKATSTTICQSISALNTHTTKTHINAVSCNSVTNFLTSGTVVSLFNSLTFNVGDELEQNLLAFSSSISYLGLQIVGLLFGLIIAYDLVEQFGHLLGAPSVQGRRVLSRVL